VVNECYAEDFRDAKIDKKCKYSASDQSIGVGSPAYDVLWM